MNPYLKKLMSLILEPTRFFKAVNKEKDYWTVLKFFATIYIAAMVLQYIILIPYLIKSWGNKFVIMLFFGMILSSIFAFAWPFVSSFLSNLGVWLLGGRNGYFNTFKPVAYGLLITIPYGFASSLINTLFSVIDLSYITIGTTITGIITLAAMIHSYYVQAIGVSQYHSISRIKAFIGVIMLPLACLVLVMILAIGLVLMGGLAPL